MEHRGLSISATSEGTRRLAGRHPALPKSAFRDLGRTGLLVSAVGFGCYRVDEEMPEHLSALEAAVVAGCNLVDTSTNYGDGGSERAVGRGLRSLFESGRASREEVVVVSKIGYVQGGNLELVRSREREGRPFGDVVRYADGCWHCIHPDFLSDQIGRSLGRLGLERLDGCLLHNPEYFLSDAHHRRSGTLEERRDEFYRRIDAAFRRLEDECDAGRISWYGVSSNTFVAPAAGDESTSLSRMIGIARAIARERGGDRGAGRFAIIQLPANLLETGAFLERNNGADLSRTVLEEAENAGLAVLVNRPLNAFTGRELVRLADFPGRMGGMPVEQAAARVQVLEAEFVETIAPALELPAGGPRDLFHWGKELEANAHRFADALHWRQVEHDYVRPRLEHALAHVPLHLVGRARNDWAGWVERYRPAIDELVGAVGDLHGPPAQARSESIGRRLDPHLPPHWRGERLSRKAIAALSGARGVTSVLVGMRRPEYVVDAMRAMAQDPPALAREAWQAIAP